MLGHSEDAEVEMSERKIKFCIKTNICDSLNPSKLQFNYDLAKDITVNVAEKNKRRMCVYFFNPSPSHI